MQTSPSTTTRCPFSSAARNLDPFDPSFHRDPFPTLGEIRHQDPIFFHESLGYWVVTKMDLAKQILRDAVNFSADVVLDPVVPLFPSTLENFAHSGFTPGGGSLVNDENPIHDQRRRWLAQWLTPQKVKELEPLVRTVVADTVDRFVQRGAADLVSDFAHEIPAAVLLKVLAIPPEQLENVKRWAAPTTLFSWGKATEADQNHMADMLGEYWHYAKDHIANLKRQPGDDLVSMAIRGQAEQQLWTDEELTRMVLNFTFAGHETTTNTSANALILLLQQRESWQSLCADSSLIPNAIEECIRYSPAVIAHRRRATADVAVGDAVLKANDKVLMYFASANRDEAVFENAETFDIRRTGPNRHVTFGFGWHTCFGAPLARLELRLMLEELTSRLPHIELVPGQVFNYSPLNIAMRGPDSIRAVWDPARNPRPADRPTN